MKRKLLFLLSIMILIVGMVGCGQDDGTYVKENSGEIPAVNVGYIFTNHHTPLLTAASKGEEFKNWGTYLKPVIPKEKYELYSEGEKIADINLVTAKSGSETTTLFAQKHLDIGLCSVTAMMTGIDRGTPIKIISPVQTEGMALVFPKGSNLTWKDIIVFAMEEVKPLKIGYHSPTSAPRVVLEAALKEAGLKVSQDPNDMTADIILVDLKSTSNLIPALTSKQVDGWVGPAPYPAVAVNKGVGEIVVKLRDLPPEGHWHDFPCCVVGARDEFISQHPEVVEAFTKLMTKSSEWCNKHRDEAAALTAEWIGIPADAAKASEVTYTTIPSDSWKRGVAIHMETLNKMNKFNGKLQDKKLEEVKSTLFDFTYVQ